MSRHKHQTILLGAAEELLRAGKIETFDAVYNWVCPDCGYPQRTTRLADTIYTLRHAYGWEINTLGDWSSGETLATYTLGKAGDMPGDASKGPHPRKLVGNGATPTGYAAHIGKPIPVEAIPSPKQWRCTNCDKVISKPIGQPMLGGYRLGPCPNCGKGKGLGRTFVPVL